MKITILQFICIIISTLSFAQSKVMKNLAEEYPDARAFVMYHSSFTMLNQSNDPEIAALAATIDKIKVLTFDSFSSSAKTSLISELESNEFELLMSIKRNGSDVLAYISEDDDDEIEGYFLLVEMNGQTLAIDVLGSPDPKQIGKLIDTVKNH